MQLKHVPSRLNVHAKGKAGRKGIAERLRQKVVVFAIDAETRCEFAPPAYAEQRQVVCLAAFLHKVSVHKGGDEGQTPSLTHFARHNCLMDVAQSAGERVGRFLGCQPGAVGHRDAVPRHAQGKRLGASFLPQKPRFHIGFVSFLVGVACHSDRQAVRDAVVKGHAHLGVVQTPQIVSAGAQGAKAVRDHKVQDALGRGLVALYVDDAGVLEGGANGKGGLLDRGIQFVEQALCMQCA